MAMRDLIHAFAPALGLAAAKGPTMRQVLDDFRNERANDIATIADRAGRSGARLAITKQERDAWKAYARELERLCMGAGLELPRAPDDDQAD